MYIYIYVSMYIYIYVSMYIYIYMYTPGGQMTIVSSISMRPHYFSGYPTLCCWFLFCFPSWYYTSHCHCLTQMGWVGEWSPSTALFTSHLHGNNASNKNDNNISIYLYYIYNTVYCIYILLIMIYIYICIIVCIYIYIYIKYVYLYVYIYIY